MSDMSSHPQPNQPVQSAQPVQSTQPAYGYPPPPAMQGGYPPPHYMYVQSGSFTTKAVVVLVLYIFLYIPGLIANILFWNEAKKIKDQTGSPPSGYGCLVTMLVVQGICIALICLLMNLITAGSGV